MGTIMIGMIARNVTMNIRIQQTRREMDDEGELMEMKVNRLPKLVLANTQPFYSQMSQHVFPMRCWPKSSIAIRCRRLLRPLRLAVLQHTLWQHRVRNVPSSLQLIIAS